MPESIVTDERYYDFILADSEIFGHFASVFKVSGLTVILLALQKYPNGTTDSTRSAVSSGLYHRPTLLFSTGSSSTSISSTITKRRTR